MIKTGLPQTLPRNVIAATRLIVLQYSPLMAARSFHVTRFQNTNFKASYATVAPEQKTTPPLVPPLIASEEDKSVAKIDPNLMVKAVVEKRDFHWHHPIYTREEYEKIQVRNNLIVHRAHYASDRTSRGEFVQ